MKYGAPLTVDTRPAARVMTAILNSSRWGSLSDSVKVDPTGPARRNRSLCVSAGFVSRGFESRESGERAELLAGGITERPGSSIISLARKLAERSVVPLEDLEIEPLSIRTCQELLHLLDGHSSDNHTIHAQQYVRLTYSRGLDW